MTTTEERVLIERLAAGFSRSRLQLNARHESDAELVRVPESDIVLAITTDTIVEEIATGLYRDPYLAGWMIVTVNASDLAAVGAAPLGIVVSESLPPDMPPAALDALQRGIADAAEQQGLPVLGGDTNSAAALALGATAVGTISPHAPLIRRGARPGDRLFASGHVGLGSAFACAALLRDGDGPSVPFRPVGRLDEGRSIAGIASACIDTSDGVIAALDELMLLNRVGFTWDLPLFDALHPAALATARRAGLPSWTMLAGPHGEFELLFTVPPDRCDALRRSAAGIGWTPLSLGRVSAEPGFRYRDGSEWLVFDTHRIRNLFSDVDGDPARYLRELLAQAAPGRVPRRVAAAG